jgi:heme/copper-type cytochrome/quinol oxidase subunit 2
MRNKLLAICAIVITVAILAACELEVHDPGTARLVQQSITAQESGNTISTVMLIVVTIVAGFIGLGWWQSRPRKEDADKKPPEQQ